MGASVVSVGAAQPVPRPGTRFRSGGTAGYCDDLLTVSVASCPLSTHVSLSLRAICPDRAQTRYLPAHPLWGVRDARAVRLWGLRSGVTTCTANQWAAEASKSIGLGGWQAIFVKLQPCDGVPNPAPHVPVPHWSTRGGCGFDCVGCCRSRSGTSQGLRQWRPAAASSRWTLWRQ